MNYDTIIVGLGAMGSGIAYQLARGGQRVLGLDRHRPPHVYGSSHGQSRVIRKVYGVDARRYVPLIERAYTAWHELEDLSGESLLIDSGLVLMGTPQSKLIVTTLNSAKRQGLACERLEREDIGRRWPALHTDPDMCGIWDPTGGILRVEPCIEALLSAASHHGAVLQFDESVSSWNAQTDSVEVTTDRGTYLAGNLVIAAGPWLSGLLAELNLPLWIERHVQMWFEPASEPHLLDLERCPIFSWQVDEDRLFYGFPELGQGVKVAIHHTGQRADPDTLNRDLDEDDLREMRRLLERFLPDANGPLKHHDVCMYTNTPDRNFLVDFHPDHPNVLIVGGCSGHGFKFAPVIGELARTLLAGNQGNDDLEMFRMDRLTEGL